MSSKDEKRKKNRIQGGWGKSNNREKAKDQQNIDDIIIFTHGDINPQFDKNVVLDLPMACEFIEIKTNGVFNLNDKLTSSDEGILPPARVEFIQNYLKPERTEKLFKHFLNKLPWERRLNATKSGEEYLEPRETCWYGLPYSYSRVDMPPNSNWDPELLQLRDEVQQYAEPNKPFNSVMCNLYRDAKNSIDWHADDERGLGKNPMIASISLGSTRVFEMCKRTDLYAHFKSQTKNPYRSRNPEDPPFEDCTILYKVFLESGSLLTMSGSVQDYWLHRVPKEYHDHSPRINFTFRHIITGNAVINEDNGASKMVGA